MAAELVLVPSVLLDRLAAVGIDPARVLRHAGIARERFRAPKTRLTVGEFFAFWRAIAAVSGSGAFGLRIGAEAHPHQFDVAALAALHAPTFGDALVIVARYKRVVCGETLGVETVGAEARVAFHWVHVDDALPLLLVDAAFASLVMLARRGTGRPVRPLRVELARRPADAALLRHHFGCAVRFDAPGDVLVFDAAALALPFATHNADLLAVLLPGLESALGERLSGHSVTDDVRLAVGRRMRGERPSVQAVATELHMSPRTLQRRLGALGTTYQHVLDEVRHDTSRRLLGSTDLDAAEVAFLLGFDEVNSFARAFSTWEGRTPTRWRAASPASRPLGRSGGSADALERGRAE
ncbi:MAG TPA: AraC family transcriptional regulator [Gemmatirosa sp.]